MCPPQGSATWGQAEGDTPCARCPLRPGHIIISIQKAEAPGAKSSLELALFLRSLPMPGPTSFLLFFPHFPNCRSLGVCLSSILRTPPHATEVGSSCRAGSVGPERQTHKSAPGAQGRPFTWFTSPILPCPALDLLQLLELLPSVGDASAPLLINSLLILQGLAPVSPP